MDNSWGRGLGKGTARVMCAVFCEENAAYGVVGHSLTLFLTEDGQGREPKQAVSPEEASHEG